ncbi:HAMP domain-containing histidine kinase [Patescibacteria group bacterium]|nr:HAMP domain-containing histidine kinase [Patescibacteria group bacterium]MBU4368001.1 HAMP domain-containing histidine kinase [Patescibacteria group bacterium]MBU4462236.1 HAMP domain-containing histidine kinase [Patescibacteria group bacterium]MCG2699592.1 HAMP domain-containing histidine kinase [Candidatus Parcubacteria bacterium]
MEKVEKFQKEKIRTSPSARTLIHSEIGKPEYINENCWLTRNLNYFPAPRCRYCELKFRDCLFYQYLITSLILTFSIFVLSFLIEGKISKLVIISVFILVIVYGRFFNKSTEKIIEAYFAQRKAKEALEELAKGLENQVEQRTKELKEAYGKLEKLDESKNQFIMACQHHLRTPLTSMKGYAELILTGAYGKVQLKTKEVISKIQTSANRLIKTVNELLDISQFQLDKKVVSLQPNIEIKSILEEVVEELQPTAQTKNIYLKLDKPAEKLPPIKADPEKLKVALFNIFDNGIKYTAQGGITIKFQISDKKLRILSQDTGIGISKEDMKTLFSGIFERGEEAKKLFTTGRGIGLYISSKIIEAHNGKIWVESEGPGKGSTFFIELPIS